MGHAPEFLLWLHLGVSLWMASPFVYFLTAGAKTIDRNFYTALGGEVPAAVCRNGPYKFVRHPFYLSYAIAFLGVAAAFPSLATECVCLLNIGLFLYMAFDDERVLLLSPLAADYQAYRLRTGMLLPRLGSTYAPRR
jgi:protein-S-isoprenylcysteine O-methyltransferase Ste14